MAKELAEILNLCADMIAKMPDLAVWILAGVGIFKLTIFLATTGSVVLIAKLLINKVHHAFTAPKTTVQRVRLGNHFIDDCSVTEINDMFHSIRSAFNKKNKTNLGFLHSRDVQFMKDAVMEKIEREMK